MPEGLKQIKLPLTSEELIPHRMPMLFVDSLVVREGDSAKGTARVPDTGICLGDEGVFPEFFVEVVAQTVAMANGYDFLCSGRKMPEGMLVGIDSFELHHLPRPGEVMQVSIEKSFEFGAVTIIHGEIFSEGRRVASGDIKVWEKPES